MEPTAARPSRAPMHGYGAPTPVPAMNGHPSSSGRCSNRKPTPSWAPPSISLHTRTLPLASAADFCSHPLHSPRMSRRPSHLPPWMLILRSTWIMSSGWAILRIYRPPIHHTSPAWYTARGSRSRPAPWPTSGRCSSYPAPISISF